MARKILSAMTAAGGSLPLGEIRKAAGATIRGSRIVRARLEDAGHIERAPDDAGGRPSFRITDAGRAALGVATPLEA